MGFQPETLMSRFVDCCTIPYFIPKNHKGGYQNYGPFLAPYKNTAPII